MSKVGTSALSSPSVCPPCDPQSMSMEDMMQRIQEMEKLLQEKDKTPSCPPTSQSCPLCLVSPPNMPVPFIAYPANSVGTKPRVDSELRTCPYSQKNPVCLECARRFYRNALDNRRRNIKCLGRCCFSDMKDGTPMWGRYGEPGRTANDSPCPAMYAMMDANGIGDTKCRKCEKDCGTMAELVKHNRSGCRDTCIQCNLCQKRVPKEHMDEHKTLCFRYCVHCGPCGPKLTIKEGFVFEEETNTFHSCENKVLRANKDGTCCHYTCHRKLTMKSILAGEHKKCCDIRKGETTICKFTRFELEEIHRQHRQE